MRSKKFWVFRGLPGSGKSTLAKSIGCLVIEPQDQYAMQSGMYCFFEYNRMIAEKAALLIIEDAFKSELDVALADVLAKKSELLPYLKLAKQYEYDIIVEDLKIEHEKSLVRNKHEISEIELLRMIKEWEDFDSKWLDLI